MNQDMYKMVIMDHFKFPHNKIENKEGFIELEGFNPSCGDKTTIYLRFVNDK